MDDLHTRTSLWNRGREKKRGREGEGGTERREQKQETIERRGNKDRNTGILHTNLCSHQSLRRRDWVHKHCTQQTTLACCAPEKNVYEMPVVECCECQPVWLLDMSKTYFLHVCTWLLDMPKIPGV